jgi:hypothetical protein
MFFYNFILFFHYNNIISSTHIIIINKAEQQGNFLVKNFKND